MVNSVFGKTMENLRKRVYVDIIIENQDKLQKSISSPYFANFDVIVKNKIAIVKKRAKKII
jgi:hypothetical protein